jgi:gamma-glutamyltranspeptidase / glutathione hydrolase
MPAMIVAPQPPAVEEGAKVLASGGNAFDAALACAFAQFVVDPHSCGVGGYLLMAYQPAGDKAPQGVLDAPALAGSKVTPGMWADVVLGPNPSGWGFFLKDRVNEEGYQSICTPSMVRGLEAIHRGWCTRRWADLIAPAIRMANEGWTVGGHLASGWKRKAQFFEGSSLFDKLHVTPAAKRIYLKPDGASYEAGEQLRNPDFARTLERLAEQGSDDFYHGALAEEMAADLAAHGSWVTADDLARYTTVEGSPVVTTYRGWTIQTSPPPHGGPTLAAILNILEG